METKAQKLARVFLENKPEDLDLNPEHAMVNSQPRCEVLRDGGLRIHYQNPLATTVSKWRVIDLNDDQAINLAYWLKKNYLPPEIKRVK